MKGLLFLLYCIQILGAHLRGAQSDPRVSESISTASHTVSPSASSSMTEKSTLVPAASSKGVAKVTTAARTTRCSTPMPTPTPQPSMFDVMFNRKECLPVLMVTGGLVIGCAILLVSTVLLAWKVCQLSRRLNALSSGELISTSEYWTGSAKKNKSKSEAEPNETAVLMADLSQTQEETGAAKEEAGKVNGDGQMAEENKKEEGNAASGEEASTTPAAAAENSTTSEKQEENTESQPTEAEEASTSEGTEDVV